MNTCRCINKITYKQVSKCTCVYIIMYSRLYVYVYT